MVRLFYAFSAHILQTSLCIFWILKVHLIPTCLHCGKERERERERERETDETHVSPCVLVCIRCAHVRMNEMRCYVCILRTKWRWAPVQGILHSPVPLLLTPPCHLLCACYLTPPCHLLCACYLISSDTNIHFPLYEHTLSSNVLWIQLWAENWNGSPADMWVMFVEKKNSADFTCICVNVNMVAYIDDWDRPFAES